jgi:phosphoribosylaminoimidazolecarboxamide formyltransferase/IMP cyclohydrolase
LGLEHFQLIAGMDASYNSWVDVDRLLQTITHIAAAFDVNRDTVPFIAVAVKHGNACGAAVGSDPIDVIQKMVSGDTRAIFGGVVMTNFPLNAEAAETLLSHLMPSGQRRLLDAIVAPNFDTEAIEMLRRRGDRCRFLANPALGQLTKESLDVAPRLRYVRGGFLLQPNYTFVLNLQDAQVEKMVEVPAQEDDILLAWAVGCTSNSNTITLVKDSQLIGNAVGQQDRVGACVLAVQKATEAIHWTGAATAYSDSFFPFPDGPEVLAKAGISTIFSSSGSIRDKEVRKVCEDWAISLYLVPDAVGRGFYGH